MFVLAALTFASFAAAPVPKEPPDPVKQAQQGFQGEWKIASLVTGGKPKLAAVLPEAAVTVTGTRMTVRIDGSDEEHTLVLDPKASPPAVDFKQGGSPPLLAKGIYLLEKDRITICVTLPGEERPAEFASPCGSRTALLVLERVKK